ncbi:SDR family NAD(P)-dependent oxidoreductase [Geomicrobium sp. JCM 19039]|uniref:SDR family NAD(P)-dependent oxidoreductase n=1 Tax=Geomicrobium sp. JCM 19039 TaxID=1460636 RepID=UPI00045F4A73|nr:glucose 1-dehydrogenase [Geomicrobium sp. JCM 19039]GAK13942.1 3-oxoacyl-[acyl-carrier protein] reductase [Geomicrobium sp. JCM 19039]
MSDFKDKVAVVTGASSGMGRTVAAKLAAQGASIVAVDIVEDGGKETVEEIINNNGTATFIRADVTSADDVKNYVDKTIEMYGKIDLFFNNAGIVGDTANLAEQPIEQIQKTIEINLLGAMYGMKYVLAEMVKAGGGKIVSTASGAGLDGTKGMSSYSASKHGVIGFTKSAALEYAADNININAVAPGSVDTPMIRNIDPETQDEIAASIPMGRLGKMEDIANSVLFLFCDGADYITGVTIPVDGGISA